MTRPPYKFALSFTSQFYFCALPVRLDSYSQCQFRCQYCFAQARGGASRRGKLQIADPRTIQRTLEGRGRNRSVIGQLLDRGQPLHLGGMSDPFLPLERKEGITYEILKLLADYNHPVVISTKGDLFRDDKYLDLLSRGRFILQLSMTSVRDALMRDIDVGTPGPSKLLLAGSEAAQAGVSVACRIQPLIPGLEKEAADVISACAQTGFRHVAVEHLKLPVERWQAITHLSDVLGFDLRSFYRESGAERVGREWVLPAELRLPTMLELRDLTHASGMTFGAADTDLLLLSDGRACCSGIDLLHKSFGSFFTYTYTEACRQGLGGEIIRMTRLDEEWRPIGTVSRFVNSSSRLPTSSGAGAGIDDYIRRNWNGSRNGPSPQTLYGVEETGDADDRGFAFYRMNDRVRRLINRSD